MMTGAIYYNMFHSDTITIKSQMCMHVCMRPLRRVSGSQSTPSQKLVHHLTERSEATGGIPLKALTTAQPMDKNTRPLGVRDRSEMVLDTHLCSPVVSERASSERGNWVCMVASWSQATVFLASLHVEVSGEKRQEG